MYYRVPMCDNYYFVKGLIKFLIPILLLFSIECGARDILDSLNNELEIADDINKGPIYMELFIKKITNYDSALLYANEARRYSLASGDSLTYVRAEYAMAYLYKGQGLFGSAIEHYDNALKTARNNGYADREKAVLNGLALSYYNISQFDRSLDYHFQSLELREKEGNKEEVAISANNIGLVYYQLKNYNKAILYLERAKKIEEELNIGGLDGTYVNLGLAYLALNRLELALENFNNVLLLCEAGCQDLILVEALNGAGSCLIDQKQLDAAEEKISKALSIALNNNLEVNLIVIYNNLARISIGKEDFDAALDLLAKGQEIAERLKIRDWSKKNFKLLAEIYNKIKNYQLAYENQVKYDSVSSEILDEVVAKNLLQIQVDFEERQNLEIIELQNKEIGRRTTLLVLALVISLLTALIVIILYRNNKLRRRVNRKLSVANKTIENQNSKLTELNSALEERVIERTDELRASNAALIKSNNELDNFIYKTSHDIRGPLATLQGVCNIALMDIKEPMAVDYFQKLSKTAIRLNQILSKLLVINQINNSMPSEDSIQLYDLVETIVDENKLNKDHKPIKVTLELKKQLAVSTDTDLLKIILSNLINNAFKFHKSSKNIDSIIIINADIDKDNLWITVADNGVGINDNIEGQIFDIFSKTSEMPDSTGLGLYLVKLAVDKLAGNISVEKTKDDYTQFVVVLPISQV